MKNDFNTAIYKAWCSGRCGGNNHIPYANVLLASLIDKNEEDLADSQLRVDDDTLQQIVQTESDQTQTKLDAINANITAQGEAIVNAITDLKTTLGTKLDALNTAIAGVDASVDEVTAAVNDVNTDTESIDAKMDTANTNITAVKTSVDTVKTAVDTANTNITAVKTSVDTVKTSVDTANTKLDDANAKLDTIATNTTPAAAAETDGGA